ncbi:MAG: DinB family protein [Chloroflexota bacterium]|nr:DinB family protein [Chloroflexota bacterium]
MKKARTLDRLKREWQALLNTWKGLPEDVLLLPGAVGHWSTRDVMAHIATWEEEALKALPLILEGKPLPRYMGIDAFNAREQARKRHLPLKRVKEELLATHKKLVQFLENVPESAFASPRFTKRLRLDAIGHYREHAAQIAAWRTEQGY